MRPSVVVWLEVIAGADQDSAFIDAFKVAACLGVPVQFEFNSEGFRVYPDGGSMALAKYPERGKRGGGA